MYELQHHFPYDVTPSDEGKVILTIRLEAIHVQSFLYMLESLSGFFRIVNYKAKVALAYTRLPHNQKKAAKYYDEFCSATVETFKILRRDRPESTRELISVTLREIKEKYPNASYNIVKQILTKSGELKKNGFYK